MSKTYEVKAGVLPPSFGWSGMLFAPAELMPYDWWFIKTSNAWQERYWQAEYEAWAEEMRGKPELLEAYKRYRALMDKM